MWHKSKNVLLSSVVTLSLLSNTSITALANTDTQTGNKIEMNQNVTLHYVKVMFDDKVIYHEQVPTKTMIQVFNQDNEVIDSDILKGDQELKVKSPELKKGKMLSYWSIENEDNKLLIKPVIIDQEEITVNFYASEGGLLLDNNVQSKEIAKSVNKGTELKEIITDVNAKPNYKFQGWYQNKLNKDKKIVEEKVENIEKVKLNDTETNYKAKFYLDFNDNDIDDKTEEIKVDFISNSKTKIPSVNHHVGDTVKLPKMTSKGAIFMGWYTDKDFKEKFVNDGLMDSVKLYGKWEKAEKVITESSKKPITDKDVSDQVEKILNERLKDLEEKKPKENAAKKKNEDKEKNSKPNKSSKNNTKENKAIALKEGKKSNPEEEKDSNPEEEKSVENENVTLDQIDTETEQKLAEVPSNANANTFKETRYAFENKNIGQMYLVKFFDEEGRFLFSSALPYGRTIKTFDQNENFKEEYAVRQDTSITLVNKDYINDDSVLLNFETSEKVVNATTITEVKPVVAEKEVSHFKEEHDKKEEQNSKKLLLMSVLMFVAAISIGIGLFLLKRKTKRKEKTEE